MDQSGPLPQPRSIGADIRLLGGLLGQTLIDQEGPAHFALEEQIRQLAKQRRAGDAAAGIELDRLLQDVTDDTSATCTILKAFASWFHLVNLAEVRQRVRILRSRKRDAEQSGSAMDETILAAMRHLKKQGRTAAEIQSLLDSLFISPVFTAHPTESLRRTILDILRSIDGLLEKLDDAELLPSERQQTVEQIHDQVTLLWQSDETRSRKPTVMDEVRNNGTYWFEHTLFHVVPEIYRLVEIALADSWPDHGFRVPVFLRWGSWIGGDRDGNPFVDNEVTENALREQKETILKQYNVEVDRLYRRLSPSRRRVSISSELDASLERDLQLVPAEELETLHRFDEEPYRLKMILIFRRLRATRARNRSAWQTAGQDPRAYRSAGELLDDLELVERSLAANRGGRLVRVGLGRLIRMVQVFGFHLAGLEIRQHSTRFSRALAEVFARFHLHPDYLQADPSARLALLQNELDSARPLTAELDFSDETNQTLGMMRLIRRAQAELGVRSLETVVISMTTSAVNVLEVLVLARDAGLFGKIDIVPLFETVDDLVAAPQIMQSLFDCPVYGEHLRIRNRSQQIMIGYSDSNKDGGFLQANWLLFRAQEKLAETCRANGILLTLFHGRGGSLGRGGGPANRAILAQPPDSVRGRIKLTEQGEVISSRYSNPVIANRHLEQLVSAVLLSREPRPAPPGLAEWSAGMDQMAAAALGKYRALVTDPGFIPFFSAATPIQFVEYLNLGSRPSRRKQSGSIADLRAIPWVFAWTQSRIFLPSWYGAGTGFQSWLADDPPGRTEQLKQMYEQWPFFRTLVQNLHLGMSRADLETGSRYAALAGDEGRPVFAGIVAEFELTARIVLEISGHQRLLDTEPWLQNSIEKRNPYVDPLNWLQVILNRKFDEGTLAADPDLLRQTLLLSVSGIAAGLQSVG